MHEANAVTDTTASAAPHESEASTKVKGEVSVKLFARTDVGQVRELSLIHI